MSLKTHPLTQSLRKILRKFVVTETLSKLMFRGGSEDAFETAS